jgi:hypothetical protein
LKNELLALAWYLWEDGELGTGDLLALGLTPDTVVAALHQSLLQSHGILNEGIIVQALSAAEGHLETFNDSVEGGIITLTQQEQ